MDFFKGRIKHIVIFALFACFFHLHSNCEAQQNYRGIFRRYMGSEKMILLTGEKNRNEEAIYSLYPVKKIGKNYYRCLGMIEEKQTDGDTAKIDTITVNLKNIDNKDQNQRGKSVSFKRKFKSSQILDVLINIKPEDSKKIRFKREQVYISSFGSKIYQLNINDFRLIGFFGDTQRLTMLKNYQLDLELKANMVKNAFLPAVPIQIIFNDDSTLEGIIDYPDKSYLDQMLDIGRLKTISHYNEYIEFEAVQYSDAPYVVKQWPKRADFLKTSVTRFSTKEQDIKRQGLFTNKYTWMGRNNNSGLDNFYISCGLLNDYQEISRYELIILDSEMNTSTLFLNDLLKIKTIRRFPLQIQDYQNLYNKIRDMRDTLKLCWEERNNENLYVEFYDKPVFKGKLVEYVQGYHISSIPHAVVKDEYDNAVILRVVTDINAIHLESEFNEKDKAAMDIKVKIDETPKQTITAYKLDNSGIIKDETKIPVSIVSDKQFTNGIELTISSVTVKNPNLPYGNILDKIILDPEQSLNACVADITITDKTVNKDMPKWIFFDEFSLHDKSGKNMDKSALINTQLRSITDVITMEENKISFKLLFYIPKNAVQLYFRYLDMPSFKITVADKKLNPAE
ncbi:hypothetical protein J7L67_07175 [bacterium]|nr:hypothetical protein [bacterium]